MDAIRIAKDLGDRAGRLVFGPPVTHVYNPLDYAWRPHARYLEQFAQPRKPILLLGMNPGPNGMAQTGVPFGDVVMVRDWLGISEEVGRPAHEHPKRPVLGFACPRSEVSGTRLWGWARDRFSTPERFFERFFVANYCPLCFMIESGCNFTPDKLPATEKERLFGMCDQSLRALAEHLQPIIVIGVGAFAEARAKKALAGQDVGVGRMLHPSPASPAANRGWASAIEKELEHYGILVN